MYGLTGAEKNTASSTTVASVRASSWDKFFPAETDTTIPSVSSFNKKLSLINKTHTLSPSIYKHAIDITILAKKNSAINKHIEAELTSLRGLLTIVLTENVKAGQTAG
jgi:hypothetical protein